MEKREYAYRVEPLDCDMRLRARVVAMGDYILATAGEDAYRNGFGTAQLGSNHLAWVLSRIGIEFYRIPCEYERFSIYTWIGEVGRASTTRNFEVVDSSGAIIGAASSLWAVIDTSTRRLADLSRMPLGRFRVDAPAPVEAPRKLPPVEHVKTYSHTVRYSDIDFNSHANSMRYLEWVFDTLSVDDVTDRECRRVDINFLHESLLGQPLAIATDAAADPSYEICSEDATVNCRLQLLWR